MDQATWAALTATLTIAGAIWTWASFRRHGAATALRALAFTLLPAVAWLTGTLEMVTLIAGSVSSWATSLVFDPRTWSGIALAGVAMVLWVVSGVLRDRQLSRGEQAAGQVGTSRRGISPKKSAGKSPKKSTETSASTGPVDDDLADIEAMLRKRGIQ